VVYPFNVVSLCNTVSVLFNPMQYMGESYHIVDPTEDPVASGPVAQHARVVLRLVSC
jgi:hypothetical protein